MRNYKIAAIVEVEKKDVGEVLAYVNIATVEKRYWPFAIIPKGPADSNGNIPFSLEDDEFTHLESNENGYVDYWGQRIIVKPSYNELGERGYIRIEIYERKEE